MFLNDTLFCGILKCWNENGTKADRIADTQKFSLCSLQHVVLHVSGRVFAASIVARDAWTTGLHVNLRVEMINVSSTSCCQFANLALRKRMAREQTQTESLTPTMFAFGSPLHVGFHWDKRRLKVKWLTLDLETHICCVRKIETSVPLRDTDMVDVSWRSAGPV